jgi:outer membrane protein assembly factor BamB
VAGGAVYGDTSTTVFALNAATGRTIWVNRGLLNRGQGAFEIQPQVADGRVYLASAYGSGPGGGVLIALSAATGRTTQRLADLGVSEGWRCLEAGFGAGGVAGQLPLRRSRCADRSLRAAGPLAWSGDCV